MENILVGFLTIAVIVLYLLMDSYREAYHREKKSVDGLIERLVQTNKTIAWLKEQLGNDLCDGQDKGK